MVIFYPLPLPSVRKLSTQEQETLAELGREVARAAKRPRTAAAPAPSTTKRRRKVERLCASQVQLRSVVGVALSVDALDSKGGFFKAALQVQKSAAVYMEQRIVNQGVASTLAAQIESSLALEQTIGVLQNLVSFVGPTEDALRLSDWFAFYLACRLMGKRNMCIMCFLLLFLRRPSCSAIIAAPFKTISAFFSSTFSMQVSVASANGGSPLCVGCRR